MPPYGRYLLLDTNHRLRCYVTSRRVALKRRALRQRAALAARHRAKPEAATGNGQPNRSLALALSGRAMVEERDE
jgi:hypothetical protein